MCGNCRKTRTQTHTTKMVRLPVHPPPANCRSTTHTQKSLHTKSPEHQKPSRAINSYVQGGPTAWPTLSSAVAVRTHRLAVDRKTPLKQRYRVFVHPGSLTNHSGKTKNRGVCVLRGQESTLKIAYDAAVGCVKIYTTTTTTTTTCISTSCAVRYTP